MLTMKFVLKQYDTELISFDLRSEGLDGFVCTILAKHGYPPTPPEIYEKVYNDIVEQAENFKKYN